MVVRDNLHTVYLCSEDSFRKISIGARSEGDDGVIIILEVGLHSIDEAGIMVPQHRRCQYHVDSCIEVLVTDNVVVDWEVRII